MTVSLDATLFRRLLEDGAGRLTNRHSVVLFTDGEASYGALFPQIFGVPYHRYRYSNRGRPPEVRYRISRSLAHVLLSKKRTGQRLESVNIKYRHGTRRRAQEALYKLRHVVLNTAVMERRNTIARRMNTCQTRRSLAFGRHPLSKLVLGWWTFIVYNWCRTHRILKAPLLKPTDKKSMWSGHRLWPLASLLEYLPLLSSFVLQSTRLRVGDNLTRLPRDAAPDPLMLMAFSQS